MDTKLYTMTYTLNSGIKGTVNLSPKQIEEWINCYKEKSRYVTIIGKEYFGINSDLVADFKVHNAYSEQRIEIEVVKQLPMVNDELVEAYDQKKVRIVAKVNCKCCSTIYTTELDYKMPRTLCTKCKQEVYLDRDKGIIYTGKGEGYYYSNQGLVKSKEEI